MIVSRFMLAKNVHFLLLDNWPSVALSRSFMLKSIKLKLYGLQLGCWAGPPQPEFCCWHGILGLPLFPEKPLQATCTKWIQWNLRRTTDPCMQTKTTCCPVAGTQALYSCSCWNYNMHFRGEYKRICSVFSYICFWKLPLKWNLHDSIFAKLVTGLRESHVIALVDSKHLKAQDSSLGSQTRLRS